MTGRRIYLLRHGAVEDATGRYVGRIDPPLGPLGRRQAEALRQALEGCRFAAVHASDLARARETAEIVAAGRRLAVQLHPDLREVAMGEWEGRRHEEIAAACPGAYRARGADIARHRPPGGESFADCRRRVVAAFGRILAATDGELLIVGHAGVNRALLCHLLGMPTARLFALGQDPGCLNLIVCGEARRQVALVNWTPAEAWRNHDVPGILRQ